MPTKANTESQRLRLLVAIASYGDKNFAMLQDQISTYRRMNFDLNIIVLSNAPKNLGPDIEVIIGLPTADTWSLPFAHKPILVEKAGLYDLFIYTEDDIGVTEDNIRAFLRLSPHLASDEIAGFLRYEIGSDGSRSFPDMHGAFHWRPETVRYCKGGLLAEYSNEHAGFYILTQNQLQRCVASGGLLKGPHTERYGLPETAATDVYTICGFRKVICISELEHFVVHHKSNRYVGNMGIPASVVNDHIQTMQRIANKQYPATTLCDFEAKIHFFSDFSKDVYEPACEAILDLVPADIASVLSIGCGSGSTEVRLQKRGVCVTALPLDSVVGASAEELGIEVVLGPMDGVLKKLEGRTFDCVMVLNLLHLLPLPLKYLTRFSSYVSPGGSIILMGPNLESVRLRLKQALRVKRFKDLTNFGMSGISSCAPRDIAQALKNVGMDLAPTRWFSDTMKMSSKRQLKPAFGGQIAATSWIVHAHKPPM